MARLGYFEYEIPMMASKPITVSNSYQDAGTNYVHFDTTWFDPWPEEIYVEASGYTTYTGGLEGDCRGYVQLYAWNSAMAVPNSEVYGIVDGFYSTGAATYGNLTGTKNISADLKAIVDSFGGTEDIYVQFKKSGTGNFVLTNLRLRCRTYVRTLKTIPIYIPVCSYDTFTSASKTETTSPMRWVHDAANYDTGVTITGYFCATLESAFEESIGCELYDRTASAVRASLGSNVGAVEPKQSVTGAFTSGNELTVRASTTFGSTGKVHGAYLVLVVTNASGLSKALTTALVWFNPQQVDHIASTAYAGWDYNLTRFNRYDYAAGSVLLYYEATLLSTTAVLAYSALKVNATYNYDVSEVTTSTSTYARKRSARLNEMLAPSRLDMNYKNISDPSGPECYVSCARLLMLWTDIRSKHVFI